MLTFTEALRLQKQQLKNLASNAFVVAVVVIVVVVEGIVAAAVAVAAALLIAAFCPSVIVCQLIFCFIFFVF